MKKFKFFLYVIVVLSIFGGGYYIGTKKVTVVEERLSKMKSSMEVKILGLEKELSKARVKVKLVDVKDKLLQARTDVIEKNFGNAGKQIDAAREAVEKAVSSSDDDTKKTLKPINDVLIEIKADINKLNIKVTAKIDDLKKEIDRILSEQRQQD
ncbi:MAG: hypothetical protein HZA05_01605 [Nitrospirae bacterium]|nr:hypothetical protein [Nitrospirota bacterium]